MTNPIPTLEPEVVTAGDTVTWRRYLPNHLPVDGWALSYALVNAAGLIAITSTADDDSHLVEVPAATTAAWTAGDYTWQAYVTSGSDRHAVGQGSITIRPNFAAASSGLDARSHPRKVLDALQATMEGKASSDQLAMSIRGRSISRMGAAELIKWLDFYEKQVAREEQAERARRGLRSRRRISYRIKH